MHGSGCPIEASRSNSGEKVSPITGHHERKFSHPYGSPLLGFTGSNFDDACLARDKIRLEDGHDPNGEQYFSQIKFENLQYQKAAEAAKRNDLPFELSQSNINQPDASFN